MKIALASLALASCFAGVSAELKTSVVQTYFIPLPEDPTFLKHVKKISSRAGGPMNTLISITTSTDNTIIFYDHHEDGFEIDPTNPVQPASQVWGDGNAANGCAPGVSPCTDEADVISAGKSFIIQNQVPVNPRGTSFAYDGGDRIQATFPIAVVRAEYPQTPGSELAGAVEVLEMSNWGSKFIAPVGTDIVYYTNIFGVVGVCLMAGYDGTTVWVNGVNTTVLDMGEAYYLGNVKTNTLFETSLPVQADLLTGAPNSAYQNRWFSLLPVGDYSNSYLSPVGDSKAHTRVLFHNPSTTSNMTVTYQYYGESGSIESATVALQKGANAFTTTIPTGSAVQLTGSAPFIALSMTDTTNTTYDSITGENVTTLGQYFDWGYPVMPMNMLTSQVLVGLGFGCTNDVCRDKSNIHSVVWVTGDSDCDVYVDYDNDGVVELTYKVPFLKGQIIVDSTDTDMSGALIWATQNGTGPYGPSVRLAAAWGQNPESTRYVSNDQTESMDLGTTVLPLPTIKVSKSVYLALDKDGDGAYSPGDTLEYTIVVANVGQVDIAPNVIKIVDDNLDPQLTYVPGSTRYITATSTSVIPDDTTGATLFPLDEAGIYNTATIKKRGGVYDLVFNATIKHREFITSDIVVNSGYAKQTGQSFASQPNLTFSVMVPLTFPPIVPTSSPTIAPTVSPTIVPTDLPTTVPTGVPTVPPTTQPTDAPTSPPTIAPSKRPSQYSPPGSFPSGGCPIPVSREYLELSDTPTPVTHNLVGPGYVPPPDSTTGNANYGTFATGWSGIYQSEEL